MKSKNFLYLIFAALLSALMSTLLYASSNSTVAEITDFKAFSRNTQKNDKVLILMLHSENCPYCYKLEKEVLEPIQKQVYFSHNKFNDKLLVGKIQIDGNWKIKNYLGVESLPSSFAERYDSDLTPTLLFLDNTGKQLALPIIGLSLMEYFEEQVTEAIGKLH